MKQNNQITSPVQLEIVLKAVEEYYNFNACTTTVNGKDKTLTVSQLLNGAIDVATVELQSHKKSLLFVDELLNKEVQ